MSKLKLTVFIIFSVLTYPTLSYSKSPIDCARIPDNANRLSCYDQIFSEFANQENTGGPSKKPDAAPANWEITSTYVKPGPGVNIQNPTLVHSATTPSTNQFIRHPDKLTHATLTLLCQPEGTGLWIRFGGMHLAPESVGDIKFSLDSARLDAPQFSLSDNSEAIGTIDLKDIRRFLGSLQKGTMLGLSVTPLIGKPVSVSFDISGIDYVDRLFDAVCQW